MLDNASISKAKIISKEILESKKTTVLTGAGISTESGIPDFRSPGSGIWSRFSMDIMSSDTLYGNPAEFYKQGLKMLKFLFSIKKAKPNKAHKILAQLEKEGLISTVITQNIDGLHIKAGSKRVYEVHGNLREAYCLSCGENFSFGILIKKVMRMQIPPKCDSCGGIIRPNVVLFEDELPSCFTDAIREVEKSSLLLIIGSSLEVSPVNTLPYKCRKFIIINKKRTYFDPMAYQVWHESATVALDLIYKEIKNF